VADFRQTQAYQDRKMQRFRSGDELVIAKNPAFTLSDSVQRDLFAREYKKSSALYYQGQPDFDQLLDKISKHLNSM
jgi:hypothetical protein